MTRPTGGRKLDGLRGGGWLAAGAAVVVAFARPALAQAPRDTAQLKEIVVTADRVPTPLAATTSAVSVLTGAELRSRGITTVAEALRSVPGADVVATGPYGGETSLFLRGGESDYVRVLVDGVPLNAPGGAMDLATLTTADVERIEIVRGPASVLYGSDAVTGVVQVFTRRGRGPARWAAEAGGGTYGARSYAARVAGGLGAGQGYSLSWSRFADAGVYAFNNAYRNDVVDGSLSLAPDARSTARLSVRYTDALYHYPTDGLGNLVYQHQYQLGRSVAASLDAGRYLTSRLEARVLLGLTEGTTDVDQEPNGPADTLGYYAFTSGDRLGRRSADARLVYHLGTGTVVTAGAAFETEAERSHSLSVSRQYPSDTGLLVVSRWNRAYYLEAVAAPARRLSLDAGLRRERNEAFGGFTTARGGAAYWLGGTKLRASVGTAFKEPSFFENYATGYVTGNPALLPERSVGWDAGLEHAWLGGRLALSATWYAERFRNLIQYTFAPPTPTSPNYDNIAAANAAGLELQARVRPAAAVSVVAQYTWTHTVAEDSGFDGAAYAQGQPLLRRPANAGSLTATAGFGPQGRRGSASLTAYWAGRRLDEDFSTYPATRVTLPAYVRLDLASEVPLVQGDGDGAADGARPAVALTVRVENLLDHRYQQVLNFPARRRAFFVGLRVSGGF